jgi:hypothetical protein
MALSNAKLLIIEKLGYPWWCWRRTVVLPADQPAL